MVVALGADLGHEHQVLGVRVEGGVDQLVGDVGSVELGGVDVVDAHLDRAAQHGEGRIPVSRWAEHARPG